MTMVKYYMGKQFQKYRTNNNTIKRCKYKKYCF